VGSERAIRSTSEEAIRRVGFDIIVDAAKKLPTHHCTIHPDGATGFKDGEDERFLPTFPL